jgi:branched-chain amino acid transport system substrate-binding protein
MLARAAAYYVARSDKKKIFILSYDVGTGRSMGAAFRKRFEATRQPGQEIVGEEYHPFSRLTDFGPYITKVMASGADCVFTPDLSIDQRRVIQQGRELGWKVEIVGTYLNDPANSSALGDMTLGNVVVGAHQVSMDTPQNREWSKIWKDRYATQDLFSRSVDSAIGLAISAHEWLFDAVRKAGSTDADAVIKAFEGSKYDTLWGPAEMRSCDHQAQFPLGIARFVKPEEIPAEFRVFDFPYIKSIGSIAAAEVSVPLAETQNGRCA